MDNNLLDTQERIRLDYLAEQTAERVVEKLRKDRLDDIRILFESVTNAGGIIKAAVKKILGDKK